MLRGQEVQLRSMGGTALTECLHEAGGVKRYLLITAPGIQSSEVLRLQKK